MGYIPQQSLETLKRYSYKTANKSLLSHGAAARVGRWFIGLWPPYVAPNTITLMGLCSIIINFLTLLYYDPLYLTEKNLAEGPPHWVYYSWGVGLFAYLTLDAMDGMQARRTGMANPLGELFDHGCDAISTTLVVILAAHALGLGRSWWTVVALIGTHVNFYLTIWDHCHTNELMLGFISDPIEGRLMICATFFISGYFGLSIWTQGLLTAFQLEHLAPFHRLPNPPLNKVFRIFRTCGLVLNVITSCGRVYRASRHRKNPTTLQGPFLQLFSFLSFIVLQVAWLSHPSINNFTILSSPVFLPFLCLWGLQFAHLMGRMILNRVTTQSFPLWDWTWVWSFIGAIDANMPRWAGIPPIIQSTQYITTIFIWIALLASFVAYARFATLVVTEMTECLDISCFTVPKLDENRQGVDNTSRNELTKKRD